jgi:hypothetical protein
MTVLHYPDILLSAKKGALKQQCNLGGSDISPWCKCEPACPTSIDEKGMSSHKGSFFAGQKDDGVCNLLWHAQLQYGS